MSAALKTDHVYPTLKQRGKSGIHIVSTCNTLGAFVGCREVRQIQNAICLTLLQISFTWLK